MMLLAVPPLLVLLPFVNTIQPDFWDQNTTDPSNSLPCQGILNCTCSMDGSSILINCKGLTKIDEFLRFLRTRYGKSKISHIYISKSIIDHLPSGAFQNLSIQKMFIRRCLVRNVSEDAFREIIGLYEIRLDNFPVTSIPSSIGELSSLRAMWMDYGHLESIQQTLQNCTQMQSLSFKGNKISSIHHSAFIRLTNLNYLDLSNNTITWLDPKTFSSLTQLRNLNLMRNRLQGTIGLFDNHQFSIQNLNLIGNEISDIRNLTSKPLFSLIILSLDENPLEAIRNDSLEKFPGLELLYADHAQLSLVEPGSFKSMTRLLSLYISNNHLSYLDKETFANVNALQKVDISRNRIKSIGELFEETPQIRDVFASYNNIGMLHQDNFRKAKFLRNLYLSHNSIQRVQKDTFLNNGQLQSLQLMTCKIKYLEKDSFRGLYSLSYLDLSHNLLETLQGSLNNLPSLRLLVLNNNYLTHFDSTTFFNMPSLQNISARSNHLWSVEGAFAHLPNLHTLKLGHNNLETITRNSVFSPSFLKAIELYDNPLSCNCLLQWLVELIANKQVTIDKARCKEPEWLSGNLLKELSVENVTQWPEDCPNECVCTCIQNITDYYIGVYCAGLHLTTAPSLLPSKTGYLDLSRNQIDSISSPHLRNLTQLEYVLLHENNLTSIPDLSAAKLRTLTLANNYLTRFAASHVDSNYLQQATLSNNPWLCDCETLVFRKWLLANELLVFDVNETKCDNVEVNGNLRNRPIISLSEALLCPSFVVLYASAIAGALGFLLLVAGGKIAYNRYRMNIKVWMYSRGICASLSCIKEEDFDEDKQFDAFISYSSTDETFVVRQLVPMLECGDKPYHLCLHYRHFAPGSFVQDSIIQAVQLSKRTIMVLSKNFLQSEWCRLEFKSAHHRVLEEKLNRLIVIILGELPPKEEIDPEINLYLESTTYLRWGENNFWNKLKYVMPRTPCVVTEGDILMLLG